jgi:hypothetical protein
VKARTIHGDKPEAGVPLTKTFQDHILTILKSDAKNPEVQNRYDTALARDRARTGPDISFSGNEANPLFHNTGSGFAEIGTTMGISRTEDSRGFVLVDLDGDGAQDVVLHNYFRNPLVALLNRTKGAGRWLRLKLQGTKSNRFGIGARVTVNGRVQELACGTGYLSGNAPELHFGLGSAERADVSVRWPSGLVEEIKSLPANRIHTLVEGNASARRSEELQKREIAAEVPGAPGPDLDVRTLLKGLKTMEGQPAGLEGPAIVVLFSISCHACVDDLKRMDELERRARELGVRVAWVTIDQDWAKAGESFRLNAAPTQPLRPASPLAGVATPTVYWVTPDRLETFTGRFAVTAALAEAAARKK